MNVQRAFWTLQNEGCAFGRCILVDYTASQRLRDQLSVNRQHGFSGRKKCVHLAAVAQPALLGDRAKIQYAGGEANDVVRLESLQGAPVRVEVLRAYMKSGEEADIV